MMARAETDTEVIKPNRQQSTEQVLEVLKLTGEALLTASVTLPLDLLAAKQPSGHQRGPKGPRGPGPYRPTKGGIGGIWDSL